VGVVELVVTLMVEVEVAGLGAKLAAAPAGSPEALKRHTPSKSTGRRDRDSIGSACPLHDAVAGRRCGEREVGCNRSGNDQRHRGGVGQGSAGARNGQRITACWRSGTGSHAHGASYQTQATEVGLNVAAAPAGSPDTLKLTVPVNPPEGVTVTV